MKKGILALAAAVCTLFLFNVKEGLSYQGLEERMDYFESRLSELTTIQNDQTGILKNRSQDFETLKGILGRVKLGVGLRTAFSMTEDEAGTKTDEVSGGRDWDKDFNIDSMRLYCNATVTDNITLEINTETHETGASGSSLDDIRLLDAFVEFRWNDYFHVRVGRHLPASDRYNLDGPYYQNSFDFPLIAQRYPNKAVGRVEGVSYWGQYAGGKFKWQFTASEGREISGAANDDPDHLQFSGRLTYNFWEPEPGFYNSSVYYGKKDVLAVGLVMFHQADGIGTAEDPEDFNGWNIDFLLEKRYDWGTIDIEAAYFDYGTNGGRDAELARAATDDGGPVQSDGSAWTAGFSYLYPEKVGWGYPQFVSRYQSFSPTNDQTDTLFVESKLELGMHYILQDQNAKIALVWSNEHLGGTENDDRGAVKLGMQFQH